MQYDPSMKTYDIQYRIGDEKFTDYVDARNKEDAKREFLKRCNHRNPKILFITEV